MILKIINKFESHYFFRVTALPTAVRPLTLTDPTFPINLPALTNMPPNTCP